MIGIDIGSQSIKVAEVKKEGGANVLKSAGILKYTGPSIGKSVNDSDLKLCAETIKKICKQIKISQSEVNISLPEEFAFTRIVKFPNLTDEEIASAVRWEAEQYIPIPLSEAVIQHIILSSKGSGSEKKVLLIAASKAIVEKYIKTVTMAGLTPLFCETEIMATARSLSPDSGANMVLDIGVTTSDIAIVENGELMFARSIPVAGEAFTRAVSQGLNLDLTRAENYKNTYGLSADLLEGKVKAVLEPVVDSVIDEVKKALYYYKSEENKDLPGSIIVAGGSSLMPNLVSTLATKLGIEAVAGNPFIKLNIAKQIQKSLEPYAPYYATSIGLAIREV